MAVKGLSFIGKLNDYLEHLLYTTVQKVGSSKAALDVVNRGYYLVNPVGVPLVVEAGSTDNIVKVTGHAFKVGDVFRLLTTANPINEFEVHVDEVVDADNVRLSGYLSAALTAGDTFDQLRPVLERMDSTGASLATTISPPIQYNRVSGGITTAVTVTEDLDVPANSKPIPVQLYGFTGPIAITTNEVNMSSTHTNDSMAIGNGSLVTPYLMNVDSDRNAYFTLRDATRQCLIDASRNLAMYLRDGANSAQINANQNLYVGQRYFDGAVNNEWKISLTGAGLVEIENNVALESTLEKIKHVLNGVSILPTVADAIAATQTNPTTDASLIAYIRGILTAENALNTALGAQTSAAQTNPATDATLIAFIRGILTAENAQNTVLGLVNDAAYSDATGAANGTVEGLLKGSFVKDAAIATATGLQADAAYAGGANATIISGLKGIYASFVATIGTITDATFQTVHNVASATVLQVLRGILKRMTDQLPAALGPAAKAASFTTTFATEHVVGNNLQVQEVVNTTGSQSKATLGANGTAAVAAPANAVGFILKNLAESADTLYWEIGAAASADSCDQIPATSTPFIPCAGTINLLAGAGGAKYAIQWIIK